MNPFARFASWWRDRSAPIEDSRGEEPAGVTIDAQGWIHGPGVIHMPSARGRGILYPRCVVRHGTATPWGTGAAIARSWRETYATHSAHVTIDVVTERTAEVKRWRDRGWNAEADQLAALAVGAGVIYQHRSLLDVAWHAAGSIGEGDAKEVTSGTVGGVGLNYVSIGIEMTCVGQVAKRLDSRWRGWLAGRGVGYGPIVPDEQVEASGGRNWHRYSPAALELEKQLDAALLARFPGLAGEVTITPSPYSVRRLGVGPLIRSAMQVGHVDVDPTRKTDPYPTGAQRGALP